MLTPTSQITEALGRMTIQAHLSLLRCAHTADGTRDQPNLDPGSSHYSGNAISQGSPDLLALDAVMSAEALRSHERFRL